MGLDDTKMFTSNKPYSCRNTIVVIVASSLVVTFVVVVAEERARDETNIQ